MNEVKWEKNSDYPMSFATCRTCGNEGLMKLAWDLQGHLCLDAKACLNRTNRRPAVEHIVEPVLVDDSEIALAAFHVEMERFAEQSVEIEELKPTLDEILNNPPVEKATQWFTCEKCNVEWSRPSTRGRPPKVCPDCR